MNDSPTLRDLAKKAGVHYTTISRALRNDPQLPEETRNRLKALAEAEGYRPDPVISRFMTEFQRGRANRPPQTLGLLTYKTRMGKGSEHFKTFCQTVSRRAAELGYRIEELWMREPGMTAKRLNKIIWTRGIDGIIIPPSFSSPAGHLTLDLTNLAVILHCHEIWRPQLHRVEPHNFQNMLIVMRVMRRRKYRRIGLMMFWGADRTTGHEWEGAYHYYHVVHPELAKIPVLYSDQMEDPAILKWVKTNRLDAVVGGYPEHADFFLKNGFKVPEKLGFACLSVNPWERPCAGLDMRAEEIDRAAVDAVVDQINRHEKGVPKIPRHILIEGVWHEGPTVRPKS